MLLFMNHCNDFAPCGPSIGQYNSYSYGPIQNFQSRPGVDADFLKRGGKIAGVSKFLIIGGTCTS